MGDLRLDGVSFSGYGNGTLMLNGVNYTRSGGGGNSFDTVLENGMISNTSSFVVSTFDDISDYEYIFIRIRDTVIGVDYSDCVMFKVSDIPVSGNKDFTVNLHRSVSCRITRTSITGTYYSGSYVNIYADIVASTEDIFPTI